jgi:hypothetical protein
MNVIPYFCLFDERIALYAENLMVSLLPEVRRNCNPNDAG